MKKPSLAKRIEARLQGTVSTPEDIKHIVKLNKVMKQAKDNIKQLKAEIRKTLDLINRKNPTVNSAMELLVLTTHLREHKRMLRSMNIIYNEVWKTYSKKPSKKTGKKTVVKSGKAKAVKKTVIKDVKKGTKKITKK